MSHDDEMKDTLEALLTRHDGRDALALAHAIQAIEDRAKLVAAMELGHTRIEPQTWALVAKAHGHMNGTADG